jgi:hypothetical protein
VAYRIGDAFVPLRIDDTEYQRGLKKGHEDLKAWGKQTDNIVTGIFQGIGQGITRVAQQIQQSIIGLGRDFLRFINDSITKASDLNETVNKSNIVFGESAGVITKWAENAAKAFGLSRQEAIESAATIGNMFKQLGSTSGDAAKFSEQTVQLAADLASFHNVAGGTPEVLHAMEAAFRGEYREIQRYIPILNAANVAQEAMRETGKTNEKALTDQDKAIATLTIALRGAGAAQGDFARTADDLANKQRTLSKQWADLSADIGQSLLPLRKGFVSILSDILTIVAPYAKRIMSSFADGIADGIVEYVVPAIILLRQLFTYWLQPGSPPKILPDLTKWGMAAMKSYLDGWKGADFSSLRDLGSTIEGILRSFVSVGDIKETDLIPKVLGTRDAIAQAITQFRQLGTVTQDTLNNIARNAGPAGSAIAGMVGAYFNLQKASEGVQQAQNALNQVTEAYDRILTPLHEKLAGIQGDEQKLRNQQRLIELQNTLNNVDSTAYEKQLARLEIQQIATEGEISDAEKRKAAATDTAQAKLDAAKKEQDADLSTFDTAKNQLDVTVEQNNLMGEQIDLLNRLAEAQKQAAEAAKRLADEATAKALRDQEEATRKAAAAADQLYQAQLRYKLAQADTSGQIAIWRDELAKTTVGSADYFDILTTITGLQERLRKEQETQAGTTLPNLADAWGKLSENVGTSSSKLAAAIKAVHEALTGPLPTLGKTPGEAQDKLPEFLTPFDKAILSGDFAKAWQIVKDEFHKQIGLTWQGIKDDWKAVTDWATDPKTWQALWDWLYKNGAFLITNSWEGMKWGWNTYVIPWLKSGLDWLGDPKSFAKVLEYAYKAGMGFVQAAWAGMKAAWEEVKKWWDGLWSGGGGKFPGAPPPNQSGTIPALPPGESGISIAYENFKKWWESLLSGGNTKASEDTAGKVSRSLDAVTASSLRNAPTIGGGPITLTVNVNGSNSDPQAIGWAVRGGVVDALRAIGAR